MDQVSDDMGPGQGGSREEARSSWSVRERSQDYCQVSLA